MLHERSVDHLVAVAEHESRDHVPRGKLRRVRVVGRGGRVGSRSSYRSGWGGVQGGGAMKRHFSTVWEQDRG